MDFEFCQDCSFFNDVEETLDINTEPKDEQCPATGGYHAYYNRRCVYCYAYAE